MDNRKWSRWLLIGLLHWLGHGRAMETYLAVVCATYGTALLIFPNTGWSSQALRDLTWAGTIQYLAWLMIAKAILSIYGVVANINNYHYSRTARATGAVLGAWIWGWFISKFALIDFPYTLGAFFAGVALLFCIRTIGLAYLNLPHPGAAGAFE